MNRGTVNYNCPYQNGKGLKQDIFTTNVIFQIYYYSPRSFIESRFFFFYLFKNHKSESGRYNQFVFTTFVFIDLFELNLTDQF